MLPRFMAGGQSVEGALKFKAPADGEALEELDTQTITASGTVTLVRRGAASGETRMKSNVILFDCNGADRILKMPVASSWKGEVTVRNISSGAYTVEVQTAAAVSTGYIDQGEAAKVWSLGTGTTIYMNGMAKVTASPDDFGVDGIKTDKITESTAGADITIPDSVALAIGTGKDLQIEHDSTNTTITSATGDLIIDNTDTNDQIILRVGTDTNATGVEIRNNSDAAIVAVTPRSATEGTVDLNGLLDQDAALTGTGDAANIAATMSHATQVAEGLDVSIAQITNVRTSGSISAVKASVTSLSGSTAGTDHYAYEAAVTVGEATADHFVMKQGAGFDTSFDASAAATTEVGWLVPANVADAWHLKTASLTYAVLRTTTATPGIDETFALAGTGDAHNIAATMSHATQVAEGLDVSIAQLTNVRTAGSISAIKGSVTSLSGSTAGTDHYAFEAAVTVGEATADHYVMKQGAGFDSTIDSSAAATTETGWLIPANKADALSIFDSSGDVLFIDTTTGDLSINIPDGVDLELGNSADDSLVHNGTNTVWTHLTGNLQFDNQAVAGFYFFDLGTDTSATGLSVRSNSLGDLFKVTGDGVVELASPVGRPKAFNSLPQRFELKWVAGQRGKPGLNGDIQDVAEATRMIADPDFEVQGTNATSGSTAYYAEGGVTCTTAAVAADQVILVPHQDASQSAWAQVTWGTDKEVTWECDITTGASIADTIYWFGLKLTNTAVVATDADQVFFRYEEGVNAGEWQVVSSIANVDTETDSNVVAAINTRMHFKIVIAADRTAKCYINGALIYTTAALTNGVDFIPFLGAEVQGGGAAGAKSFIAHGQAISRVIG